MLTNEERERDAIADARAAGDPVPTAYQGLVPPYPVWAGIRECGVARGNHTVVSYGLFHDEFETCIDLDRTELNQYFKTMNSYTAASNIKIGFTIPQRNSIIAFVQLANDKIRCGKDPAM